MEQTETTVSKGAEHKAFAKDLRGVQESLDRAAETLRNDPDLGWLEKRQGFRNLWSRALKIQAEAQQNFEASLEARAREREQSLFSVPAGMRKEVRDCFSEVSARQEYLRSTGEAADLERAGRELEDQWERARRTSDKPLEHALGWLALESGNGPLRDRYLEASGKAYEFRKYSEAQEKIDDLRSPEGHLRAALTMPTLQPPPEAME